MTTMFECQLTRKGFQWARTGHPWVYRDDLQHAEGGSGDVVRVTYEGRVLGSAFLGTRSKIALRWIERSEAPRTPDAAFWTERIEKAHARRAPLAQATNAYRVVHDAADGIPGLILDRYDAIAVVQTTTAGAERLLPLLAEVLPQALGVRGVVVRNDLAVREKEGMAREAARSLGPVPERVWVHESGPRRRVEFPVQPLGGQKTGAYLDQRENRWRAAELARGRFLDAFSNSGLFGLHAAPSVTEIVAVDTSGAALELLEEAARRNSIAQVRTVEQNVFDYLKEACQRSERFDTIVLDPPAFAKSRGEIPAAIRGYREINRRAMEILQPGGVLVSCSCSYHLSEADLIEVLRAAASDSRSDFRVLERRGQASDHPTILCHPESGYLKCILLEKV